VPFTERTGERIIVGAVLRAFASGKLFGEAYGSGEPWALALHGWGHSHEDFAHTFAEERPQVSGDMSAGSALQRDGAIDGIAIDLPGFGAAPAPKEPWGLSDYAEAIAPILEEMGDRVVLVGHSFGGRVALRIAVAYPERVAALVMSGVPFVLGASDRVRPKMRYRATRSLWRMGLMSDVHMDRARKRFGSRDYQEATGVMRGVLVRALGESDEGFLRALRVPVELIWGANDTAATTERAVAASALVHDVTLLVVADADHFTPIEAPDALRAAILKHRP